MSTPARVRIALASPRPAATLEDGLVRMERLVSEAALDGAGIVCFPEAYLPGLRGQDFPVAPWNAADEAAAMRACSAMAVRHDIAIIAGLEHVSEQGRQIAAAVFDATGAPLGTQCKTQLDPSEDGDYVPGSGRRLFHTAGHTFGIAICHEGWRYPETVRWAAARGATVVFHPQLTGGETRGVVPARWGDADGPYYEQAMRMRSRENTIYFASVNYALRVPESATSLIAPDGDCVAHLPHGAEGVLLAEIDPSVATGALARRLAPGRYHEMPGAP